MGCLQVNTLPLSLVFDWDMNYHTQMMRSLKADVDGLINTLYGYMEDLKKYRQTAIDHRDDVFDRAQMSPTDFARYRYLIDDFQYEERQFADSYICKLQKLLRMHQRICEYFSMVDHDQVCHYSVELYQIHRLILSSIILITHLLVKIKRHLARIVRFLLDLTDIYVIVHEANNENHSKDQTENHSKDQTENHSKDQTENQFKDQTENQNKDQTDNQSDGDHR